MTERKTNGGKKERQKEKSKDKEHEDKTCNSASFSLSFSFSIHTPCTKIYCCSLMSSESTSKICENWSVYAHSSMTYGDTHTHTNTHTELTALCHTSETVKDTHRPTAGYTGDSLSS